MTVCEDESQILEPRSDAALRRGERHKVVDLCIPATDCAVCSLEVEFTAGHLTAQAVVRTLGQHISQFRFPELLLSVTVCSHPLRFGTLKRFIRQQLRRIVNDDANGQRLTQIAI
jgi:hypothetical protein